MIKKKIYIDIGMVIGGIVLLFILKGESWSIGKCFFFYVCSGIGSVIGMYSSGKFLKSFIIAVVITSLLIFLGLLIVDIFNEGISVISGYFMWLPVIITFTPLYGLAGTLTMFPIMSIVIGRMKKDRVSKRS